MDLTTRNAVQTMDAGFDALWALVITYSFSVLGAIVLIIAGYLAAGLIERGLRAGLKQVPGFDATLRTFFATAARYAVLILVAVMVLGQFGVQTASIVAAIGAIGLAIGLALQGTLQNIAAGVMLLVLRPFRIGEAIEVGPVAGTVEEIGLFATRLRTPDGIYILAPNTRLWTEPVRNYDRNGVRRNDLTIGISYLADADLAQAVLARLARSDPRVRHDPPPLAFVAEYLEASLTVTLRYWTSAADFLPVKTDLTRKARSMLESHGIAVPAAAQQPAVPADATGAGSQPVTS